MLKNISLRRTCKASSTQEEKILQYMSDALQVGDNHFHNTHAANYPNMAQRRKYVNHMSSYIAYE